MNTIKVKVNFKKGTCDVTGIKLVTGDYNSTIIKLTMSDVSGTNIFNMKSPSDNLVLSTEIVNGEVPLYRETEEGIKESILAEKGNYTFEIAKYDGDSKLTSAYGKIPVRKAQVNIDKELIEPYLPVFDGLLSELSFLMNQVNTLNIAVEKEGNVTTLTITDKIGEEKVIRILDGEKGDRGERGPRGYDGNPTFYVGDFNDKPSEAEYVVEITDNGVKEHIKNYLDETGEFIDVPRATPTSDMNSTSSMSVPTTQAVKKYVAEHGADATNEISISPNQPTEANYKLWFNPDKMVKSSSNIIDIVYPVGSYYETSDTTFNPNTTWGGTWELETDGTVLVSKSSESESAFNTTVGSIVGEEKHTLTIDEMPSHTHLYNASIGAGNAEGALNFGGQNSGVITGQYGIAIQNAGGSQPHNIVQPSKIVNRWHRTA